MQELIVGLALAAAIFVVVKKMVRTVKNPGCGGSCGCAGPEGPNKLKLQGHGKNGDQCAKCNK